MDDEIENFLDKNNTDDLNDFLYEPTGWDYVQDVLTLLAICVGFVSNVIIILMVMRNKSMRSKTNLIIMNISINDACFLLSNIHFLAALMELIGADHFNLYYTCLLSYNDAGFQFNTLVFLLALSSNMLIKQKRFTNAAILTVIYSLLLCTMVINTILCYVHWWPLLYLVCFITFLLVGAVMFVKELNSCYKKCYKKDPLSPRTLFRHNIVLIYIGAWLLSVMIFVFANFTGRFLYILAANSFLASFYILIYIVNVDKNFRICFLNLLKCKGAGEYDVDATITFAEEEEEDEENAQGRNVNINFNTVATNREMPVTDITSIRVP